MNILIATHDLIARKAHLMPWRIFGEIAAQLDPRDGRVQVVSLTRRSGAKSAEPVPENVRQVSKERESLAAELGALVEATRADVLFWPLAWREPAWRIDALSALPVAKVGYIPGGVYGTRASVYAIRRIGWRQAAPYVIDSLAPRRRLIRCIEQAGLRHVITLSERTAKSTVAAGMTNSNVHYVPPGRDPDFTAAPGEIPAAARSWLGDDPYFLFMGPPSGIRGIYELLAAFESAAARNDAIRLVCLFRDDDELDSADIRRIIGASRARDRIHAEWQSVDRPTLNAWMSSARAIAMPFVIVPSEIPLAIIESMAFGKPIIATSPGGTGDFVRPFGFAPQVGDIDGLADAMLTLAGDRERYDTMSAAAAAAHAALHDWRGMAEAWRNIGRRAMTEMH